MAYAYQPYMIPTPYLWPYYQQPNVSPFIPPQQLPPAPNAGSGSRRVHFEDEDVFHTGRARPPSWHAGMMGTAPAPNPAPFPSPPFVYTPLPSVVPLGPPAPGYYSHHRRRSDGALPQAGWISIPTWMVYPQPQTPPPQLNPLLSGEMQQAVLLFDLSQNAYNPLRMTSPQATSGTPLSREELSQTATYPGATRMVITCDEIPQWRVVLEPYEERPSNAGYLGVPTDSRSAAPITVHDVLFAIHKMLQRQISHRDWVDLSSDRATSVARAYTRRCRTFPTTQAFEESQGVRRVDYLLDKYYFKGLMRPRGEQGFENMRLLVGRR